MSVPLVLHHDPGTTRFKVSFPGVDVSTGSPMHLTSFIKLVDKANNASAYLQASTRRGASGDQVWVSPLTLKKSDGHYISWEPTSARRYRLYVLLNDNGQRLALIGLAIGLVGWILGDMLPLFLPSQASLDAAGKALATSLKGVGYVLTFTGALKSGGN